jgi:UDPglucose 6-dehydrogenase
MKISIIGTGYVGLVNGACLSDMGNDVTCIDVNKEKIDMLNNGVVPIYEPGLEEIINRNVKANRLYFSNTYDSIADSEITFIAVGTPPKDDGSADLKYVLSAAREFAKQAQRSTRDFQVIVTKSTVPVGTSELVLHEVLKTLIEIDATHRFKKIGIASNPEFLKEGSAINDCLYPDRIVVGTVDDKSKMLLKNLYQPFMLRGDNIVFTDIASSEMIKYASNAMLATRISFMNEIANLCEKVGANVNDIRKGMGADKRIGDKFLYAGCGYGGSCFPKDVRALIETAKENGCSMKIISATEDVNNEQKHILFKKLNNIDGFDINGKTIAILGLAFKPETDDMREAPSLVLIEDLYTKADGVKIRAYDPISMEVCKKMTDRDVYYASSMYDAIEGADAVVLVTEWKEFRNPDWYKIVDIMNNNIVVDGRNVLNGTIPNNLDIRYYSIGR